MGADGRHLLVIGGGPMQVAVVREARRMGLRVAVMDRLENAPAMQMADEKVLADISDLHAAAHAALDLHRRRPLHGAITAGTDFPTTQAAVAEACGLPGLPMHVAETAKDKLRMREAFRAAACPQPDFHAVTLENPKRLAAELRWPQVVKPADSMGARGVRRVDDADEFLAAVPEARRHSRLGRVIVEDYVEADELSLDALVWNGRVAIRGVADRIIEGAPFFVETGHVLPSALDGETLRGACQAFVDGIRALGIRNGAAKGDLRVNRRGAFLGEIAARLSGGFMSGWTTPLATGVPLLAGAIRIALGEDPGPLEPTTWGAACERAVLAEPGRVVAVEGVEDAKRLPGVETVVMNVKPGDVLVRPTSNVEKAGHVIAHGSSRAEALERAGAALRAIRVRTEAA